jgi:hypothetical protein
MSEKEGCVLEGSTNNLFAKWIPLDHDGDNIALLSFSIKKKVYEIT